MATSKFGTLVAEVTANVNPFKRAMDDASKKSKGFAKNSQESFGKAARAFKAFAAIVGAGALIRSADQVLDKLDKIGKTADKLGIGVERLQELQFAAEQTGVSAETLNMAMQRFTRRVAEAQQGQGELKATLEQYGIALRDQNGNMRDAEDIFNDYVNVIGSTKSEQEKLRLAFKGFDSEGAALVNTLSDGTDGLESYAEQARKAGIIIDEGLVRSAEDAREKVDLLKKQFGAQFAKVIADNADEIAFLAESIAHLVNVTLRGIGAMRGIINETLGNFDNLTEPQRLEAMGSRYKDIAALEAQIKRMREEGKPDPGGLIPKLELRVKLLKDEVDLLQKIGKERAIAAGSGDMDIEAPERGGGGNEVDTIDEINEKKKEAEAAEKERHKARLARTKEVNDLFQESFDLLDEIIEKDDAAVQGYLDMLDPIAEHKRQLLEIEDLMRKYPEYAEQLGDAYRKVAEDAAEVVVANQEMSESGKTMAETAQEWGLVFNSALEDAIVNGGDLGDIFEGLIQDIIRATIRTMILKPLLDSLAGMGGFVGQIFGGISGSAGGGLLAPGRVALVGERGPELIMPNAPARVLNNHTLSSGGMGGAGNVTVEIINRGTPQEAVSSSTSNSLGVKGAIISIVTEDIRKNGPISASIQGTFGARRQS